MYRRGVRYIAFGAGRSPDRIEVIANEARSSPGLPGRTSGDGGMRTSIMRCPPSKEPQSPAAATQSEFVRAGNIPRFGREYIRTCIIRQLTLKESTRRSSMSAEQFDLTVSDQVLAPDRGGRIQCDTCPTASASSTRGSGGSVYMRARQDDQVVLTPMDARAVRRRPDREEAAHHFAGRLSCPSARPAETCRANSAQNWDISKSRETDTLASGDAELIARAACRSVAAAWRSHTTIQRSFSSTRSTSPKRATKSR